VPTPATNGRGNCINQMKFDLSIIAGVAYAKTPAMGWNFDFPKL
jgi:hypothetical protein